MRVRLFLTVSFLVITIFGSLTVFSQTSESAIPVRTKYAGWIQLKEGEKIDDYFRKNNQIFCGEARCNPKALVEVDIETFTIFPGSKYAKDKNHVYYPIHIECVKHKNCSSCNCEKYIVQHADAESFVYLGKDYAADKHSAFYRGKIMEGTDPETFRVIDGPHYFYFAVDGHHVYIHNKIFKEADPETFYFDSTAPESNELIKQGLIGDKNHQWIFNPPFGIKLLKKSY